jgi:hypothetical protein
MNGASGYYPVSLLINNAKFPWMLEKNEKE